MTISNIQNIVVHGMAYIIYKEHSQGFWDKVAAIIPDYWIDYHRLIAKINNSISKKCKEKFYRYNEYKKIICLNLYLA